MISWVSRLELLHLFNLGIASSDHVAFFSPLFFSYVQRRIHVMSLHSHYPSLAYRTLVLVHSIPVARCNRWIRITSFCFVL
ncbi:hypothetical protein BJX64DRAFT_272641 [Aspergillus heterothallicus]